MMKIVEARAFIEANKISFGSSSFVVPQYAQNVLGLAPQGLHESFSQFGKSVHYNAKKLPSMLYRSNELRRTRHSLFAMIGKAPAFKTKEVAAKLGCLSRVPIYDYPGRTWASACTYKDMASYVSIHDMAVHISEVFDLHVNHAILTSYLNASMGLKLQEEEERLLSSNDNDDARLLIVRERLKNMLGARKQILSDVIGAHRDKVKTLADGKPIIVLSFGSDDMREFRITDNDGQEVARFRMVPGILVVLSYEDNLVYKHEIVDTLDETIVLLAMTSGALFEEENVKALFSARSTSSWAWLTSPSTWSVNRKSQEKNKEERLYWFVKGNNKFVHRDTLCEVAILENGMQRSVKNAKTKRFCRECFEKKSGKKQSVKRPLEVAGEQGEARRSVLGFSTALILLHCH